MGTENTSGRSPSLMSVLQGIDRRHRQPQNPARQVRGVLEQANRQIERVPLAQLTACKTNARTHSPKQVGQIAASIKRFGFIVPVLVSAENQIVAGHGRVEAAKLLGLAEAPVLRVSHLSPAEQRAFVIADNRLAELAEWDRDTLAIELQGLIELDFDVEVTGFDMGEIELILHDDEDKHEDDAKGTGTEAKLPKSSSGPVVSRSGDVWILGPHRLACAEGADACAYAAVDAAMRRWQSFTGSAATLAGSGQSFNDVAKERRSGWNGADRSRSSAVAKRREAA